MLNVCLLVEESGHHCVCHACGIFLLQGSTVVDLLVTELKNYHHWYTEEQMV